MKSKKIGKAAATFFSAAVLLAGILGFSPVTSQAAVNNSAQAPSGAVSWNGHYYKVIRKNKVPTAAEKYCEKLGGHLVTITSEAEQNFISSYVDDLSADSYTIGATDEGHEGTWTWMDSEKWKYSNWYPGGSAGTYEPNNGNGGPPDNYCAIFRNRDWHWVDVTNNSSEDSRYFICEWDYILSDSLVNLSVRESHNLYLYTAKGTSVSSVSFKSSDLSVAKVSSKGKVVAVGAGTCKITATYKKFKFTATIIVNPAKVTRFKAAAVTETSIKLKWKKIANVSGYAVEMYDPDLEEWTSVESIGTTATAQYLLEGTTYKFRVRAYCRSGSKLYYGPYSSTIKVSTKK